MGETFIVDPTSEQLAAVGLITHKARLAFNVDTEELILSNLEQLQTQHMTLTQLEGLISLGLAAAKKLHALIRA